MLFFLIFLVQKEMDLNAQIIKGHKSPMDHWKVEEVCAVWKEMSRPERLVKGRQGSQCRWLK